MEVWSKVVSNPLGLSGFALFLVFTFMGKLKNGDKRTWISPAAFLFAAIALVGGLGIAYRQSKTAIATSNPGPLQSVNPCLQQENQVKQSSSGPGSPNVNCGHDVNITIDQSNGKSEELTSPKAPLK